MEILEIFKELLTNTKGFLEMFVAQHGLLIYALLFLIVFCETGLVVLPLLPGDSLLFTAGVLAGNPANNLNVVLIIILLITAALMGDNTNYFIGKFLDSSDSVNFLTIPFILYLSLSYDSSDLFKIEYFKKLL